MRYFDRRILFPVAAVTAFAQQQAPDAAAAEAALRARAQQFFQLQVDKKYRQAESMVADESKDAYYNGRRFNIDSYTITGIVMGKGNTSADITIKAKVTMVAPAIGQTLHTEAAATTHWKVENNDWVYVIEENPTVVTPFGKAGGPQSGTDTPSAGNGSFRKPDIAAMMRAVQLDRNAVEIKPGESQTVTVSNSLPGPVDITIENFTLPGVSATLAKTHLEQGERTSIQIVADKSASGSVSTVIDVSPLRTQLPFKITVK